MAAVYICNKSYTKNFYYFTGTFSKENNGWTNFLTAFLG